MRPGSLPQRERAMFPLNFLHQDAVDAEEHGLLRMLGTAAVASVRMPQRIQYLRGV
jgi:hypothetical protein